MKIVERRMERGTPVTDHQYSDTRAVFHRPVDVSYGRRHLKVPVQW